jgi:hypothetical protein
MFRPSCPFEWHWLIETGRPCNNVSISSWIQLHLENSSWILGDSGRQIYIISKQYSAALLIRKRSPTRRGRKNKTPRRSRSWTIANQSYGHSLAYRLPIFLRLGTGGTYEVQIARAIGFIRSIQRLTDSVRVRWYWSGTDEMDASWQANPSVIPVKTRGSWIILTASSVLVCRLTINATKTFKDAQPGQFDCHSSFGLYDRLFTGKVGDGPLHTE